MRQRLRHPARPRRLRAWWRRRSLRTRTAAAATIATVLALLFSAAALVTGQLLTHGQLLNPQSRDDQVDAAAHAQLARISPQPWDKWDTRGMGPADRIEVLVRQRAPNNAVVAQARLADLDDATLARPQWRRAVQLAADGQARVELESQPDPVVMIVVLAAVSGLIIVLIGGATWLAVGRTLRSVTAIQVEVDAIDGTMTGLRVPVPPAQDEIGRLAETMNRMLDRLDNAADRQHRFVADASHELRTPVTAVRVATEVALLHSEVNSRTVLVEVHQQIARLDEMVTQLLDLARLTHTGNGAATARPTAEVDLDEIALQESVTLRRLYPGLRVDTGRLSAARVTGHLGDLTRMVGNLLGNAARYGNGQVAVTLQKAGGVVQLAVEDDGPGVPPGDHARIFEPFVRLDDGRDRASGGTGLGLALVHAVVRAHSGTLSVSESPLGGARFTVRLPPPTGHYPATGAAFVADPDRPPAPRTDHDRRPSAHGTHPSPRFEADE